MFTDQGHYSAAFAAYWTRPGVVGNLEPHAGVLVIMHEASTLTVSTLVAIFDAKRRGDLQDIKVPNLLLCFSR